MADNPIEPEHPPDDDDSQRRSLAPREDAIPDRDATTVADDGKRFAGATPMGEPPATSLPGEKSAPVIGRYKLLRELGKGGFGVVWQAEQTEPIRREVALKIIKPGMDSREIIARFEAERQALALMDHPNIAAVLDAGTTDRGLPYFVMEMVKGTPITEYCDTHKLGIRERLELFIPVCQAVQHAHQKAILHRDLKPSNILVAEVDGKPTPKVIDFGIAKAVGATQGEMLQASLALTQEGMVIGTPQYMSPEQAGSVPDVDTRSDVYTLGVILYELLLGQTPLSREQLRSAAFHEVLRLIREGEIKRPSSGLMPPTEAVRLCATMRNTDPRKLGHALRGDLDWIVLKALEKERDRRYGTANALAQDLRRCLDDEPVSAGPPSAGYRLKKLVKRNKGPVAAGAAVLLCLIGGVAATSIALVREKQALQEAVRQRQEADRQRNAAVQAQAEERKQRDAALAAQAEERKQRDAALAAQEQERKQRELAHQREVEQRVQIHDASMAEYAVAVERLDKDGRWHEGVAHLQAALNSEPANQVAAARLYSTLSSYAPEKQNWPRQILQLEFPVESARFSADGTQIVTVSGETERVWDMESGKEISAVSHRNEILRHAEFSADGTRMVTVTNAGAARVWDVASGKAVGEAPHLEGTVVGAWLNRDGTRIVTESFASTVDHKTVQVWDVATGVAVGAAFQYEAKVIAYGTDGYIAMTSLLDAGFSPDGKWIVTASDDKTARVWDVASGKAVGEALRHEGALRTGPTGERLSFPFVGSAMHNEGAVRSAQFSPDGKYIVTASDDKTVRVWDAKSGKPVGEALRHEESVNSARFSPDGKRIVTASDDKTVRVWDVASGKAVGEALRHEKKVNSAQFSPDGTRIVTVSDFGTVRVWDAVNGKESSFKPLWILALEGIQCSADGNRIVTVDGRANLREWDVTSGEAVSLRPLYGTHDSNLWVDADGTRIIDNELAPARVWDVATGKAVCQTLRSQRFFRTPCSRKGLLLVDERGNARAFDVASGKAVGEATHNKGNVYAAEFSPNGRQIVAVSYDGSRGYSKELCWVQVWEVATGKAVGEALRYEGGVTSAQFSPDGMRIVIASFEKQALSDRVTGKPPGKAMAQVWDVATGKMVGEALAHEGKVNSAQFSPEGTRIVTASDDKTARVWDAPGAPVIGVKGIHGDPKIELSSNLTYYKSDRRIRVGATNGSRILSVWDETGDTVAVLRHENGVIFWMFSPDGKGMVTICNDETVKVWDLTREKASGDTLRDEGQPPAAIDRDQRLVGVASWKWGTGWQSAEFSPDGKRVVTVNETTVQVWDVASGKTVGEGLRHVGAMSKAQFSPDGTRIVVSSYGKTAQVWDVATWKTVGQALPHEGMVNSARFSPDGMRVVTACADKTVRVWDAATGKPVGEALRHEGPVWRAEFSPDGTRIVTVRIVDGHYALKVWDVAGGKPVGEEFREEHWLKDGIWFSPDGARIVTILESGDRKQAVGVWDVASGKELLHVPQAGLAEFSPDGTRIVTAIEKTVQVWDVASGKALGEALDNEDWVTGVEFSLDGTRIVTGASVREGYTRRVWWVPWLKDVPTPVPDWFRERAAAVAGFGFDSNGETRVIPAMQRRATLLAPAPGNDAWSILARWLAMPAGERTLTPDSPIGRR